MKNLLIFGVVTQIFGVTAPFVALIINPYDTSLFILIPICALVLNIPVLILLIPRTPRSVYKRKPVVIGITIIIILVLLFAIQLLGFVGGVGMAFRAFIGLLLITPLFISFLFAIFYISLLVSRIYGGKIEDRTAKDK